VQGNSQKKLSRLPKLGTLYLYNKVKEMVAGEKMLWKEQMCFSRKGQWDFRTKQERRRFVIIFVYANASGHLHLLSG
jgi:hypothetical protein